MTYELSDLVSAFMIATDTARHEQHIQRRRIIERVGRNDCLLEGVPSSHGEHGIERCRNDAEGEVFVAGSELGTADDVEGFEGSKDVEDFEFGVED